MRASSSNSANDASNGRPSSEMMMELPREETFDYIAIANMSLCMIALDEKGRAVQINENLSSALWATLQVFSRCVFIAGHGFRKPSYETRRRPKASSPEYSCSIEWCYEWSQDSSKATYFIQGSQYRDAGAIRGSPYQKAL